MAEPAEAAEGYPEEAHAEPSAKRPKLEEAAGESIFLTGRYLKLSRRLPQSPWFIDGQRKGDSSVEELIAGPLVRLFQAADSKFHAEGREDMDVRMLGVGRPFVVELRGARNSGASCSEAEEAVNAAANGEVVIRKVERCLPSAMAALQRDAENHRKTYVCICWCQRALAESDMAALAEKGEFELQQKTPVRVLHRRGQGLRPRSIHWLKGELINEHYFRLRVSTQAGTYVKEFVHGDLGRTRPSVRSLLGSQVEILQLDVEGVEDGD